MSDRQKFDDVIRAFEAEIANVGAHLALDGSARVAYARQIKVMADELRAEAASGRITWAQAAGKAQTTRNAVMELIRSRSTPVGRAMAQQIKSQGKTLNELIARKAQQLYGANANFNRLAVAQQNAVYGEIVASAAKSNPTVTANMRNLSRAGRGLLFISLALSVYTVVNSDNKPRAIAREATVTGAGVLGGIAGGGLAGLACGPGAPVCVTVGAFIGGALAAFGVSSLW